MWDVYYKMIIEYEKLKEMIHDRIKELYEISKQKGINDFGWKGECPNEDDYDDPDEYDAAYWAFAAYRLYIDDCSLYSREAYRFKFNDKGKIVIAGYYDHHEDRYVTGCELCIADVWWGNVREMVGLIHLIEQELGVEQLHPQQ